MGIRVIKFKESEVKALISALEAGKSQMIIDSLKEKLNVLSFERVSTARKKRKIKPVEVVREISDEYVVRSAKENRDKLVKNQTPHEVKFKALLKASGTEYLFQHIIYYRKEEQLKYFIVDFFIPRLNIVFEIDGNNHFTTEGKKADKKRTSILKVYGGVSEVFRFRNEIIGDISNDVKILAFLDKVKEIVTFDPIGKKYSKVKISRALQALQIIG